MLTHDQLIESIEQLDKIVRIKYPSPFGTPDTSTNWIMNRKLRNQLWSFKELIENDR